LKEQADIHPNSSYEKAIIPSNLDNYKYCLERNVGTRDHHADITDDNGEPIHREIRAGVIVLSPKDLHLRPPLLLGKLCEAMEAKNFFATFSALPERWTVDVIGAESPSHNPRAQGCPREQP